MRCENLKLKEMIGLPARFVRDHRRAGFDRAHDRHAHALALNGFDEAADDAESIGASIEGRGGVVANLFRQSGDIAGGNIREVCNDEVKLAVVGWEEVGLVECDAPSEAVACCVFGGKREGVAGGVRGVDYGIREFEREGDFAVFLFDAESGERVEWEFTAER